MALKVEKLVVAALPSLVETWTEGFAFKPMDDEERDALKRLNLMVFPGTVLLKKTLYECTKPNTVKGRKPTSLSLSLSLSLVTSYSASHRILTCAQVFVSL